MPESVVGLMAKFPDQGMVKTRLAREIGDKAALGVYRRLLQIAVGLTTELESNNYYRTAFVMPPEKVFEFNKLFPRFDRLFCQIGNDLGERMFNAFRTLLEKERMLYAFLIGSDIPGITEDLIDQAGELLCDNDLVLGPTEDGGYYLIGLKRPIKELFVGVSWGTNLVFDQTMAIADEHSLEVGVLPKLRDIDDRHDLGYFNDHFPS